MIIPLLIKANYETPIEKILIFARNSKKILSSDKESYQNYLN